MSRIIGAEKFIELDGSENGVTIWYRKGETTDRLWLSGADISGLTPAQIKALAQTRVDAIPGADGSGANERTDILANPRREARQWFKDNPAVRAFFEQDTAAMDSDIDAATTAQLKAIIKGCAVIARVYGLLEIAD